MKFLEDARRQQWKICSYGLGEMGKGKARKLLEWLDINPDYYCDKNSEVLKNYPIADDKKIYLETLLKVKEEVLVFVFLRKEYSEDVKRELEANKFLHVVTWKQLISDELVKQYFGIGTLIQYQKKNDIVCIQEERKVKQKDKIAIYTCITNNYDRLNEPLCVEDNCDYFFITDDEGKKQISETSVYKLIDVEKVVPEEAKTPKDKNRYCKSHGYEIFKKYDYSIYLDGSLQIENPITSLLGRIGKIGVAVHQHPYSEDVYEDVLSLSLNNRITKTEAKKTAKWFCEKKMPRFYGMVECGVIFSDHRNEMGKQLLNNWFWNYYHGAAKRDQMYMAFSLWEMGIEVSEIQTLPGNLRTNGYFKMKVKHTGCQR